MAGGAATVSEPAQLTVSRAVTTWGLHPVAAAVAALLVVGYVVGVVTLRRRRGHAEQGAWRRRETTVWLGAVTLLVLSTQSFVAAYSDSLFWLHMVQHLLLIMVVPVLLVLGRPLDLLLAALPARPAERARVMLRTGVVALLTHPAVSVSLYAATIAGTHLTGFMNATMSHPWLRGAEFAAYVISGFLLFLPLVGADAPLRWTLSAPLRMMVLVVAMPVDTFTGVVLGQTARYPWPAMAAVHPSWAPPLLTDLHLGGAIMWLGGDAIMAVLLAVCAVSWVRHAGAGDTSDLGRWLSEARVNYQADLTGTVPAVDATGDGVDELAAYNDYLRRLHQS